MIPEEEHGSWGWIRDAKVWHGSQGNYWCRVCDKLDTFEHDVVEETDIAGTLTLAYCTETGNVLDESKNRDITAAELAYVKQSLGVADG